MNKIVQIDQAALKGAVKSRADIISEDVHTALEQAMTSILSDAPVTITVTDPVAGKKITMPCMETLTKREMAALYALMQFACLNQNLRPETVQERVEKKFDVKHIGLIRRGQYHGVVDFLVDMHLRFEVGEG